jgi:hypothetical protein
MIIPDWVLEPFSNLQPAELSLQEVLIELSTHEKLKLKLKNGYQEFWLQRQIPVLYPALWAASKKFSIAFPSSYLAERGFSVVSNLLTKKKKQILSSGTRRFKIADEKYGTKYRKISVITPSSALSHNIYLLIKL